MKIVSGGQTGVDRAALDVALELGIPCGGWCPSGRKSETGIIPARYPLKETPSEQYRQRTEWNVRDSDGTMVLTTGMPEGGTALTIQFAQQYEKPCLVVDPAVPLNSKRVRTWIAENRIGILNIAGPRASEQPQAYALAAAFLRCTLAGYLKERQS